MIQWKWNANMVDPKRKEVISFRWSRWIELPGSIKGNRWYINGLWKTNSKIAGFVPIKMIDLTINILFWPGIVLQNSQCFWLNNIVNPSSHCLSSSFTICKYSGFRNFTFPSTRTWRYYWKIFLRMNFMKGKFEFTDWEN